MATVSPIAVKNFVKEHNRSLENDRDISSWFLTEKLIVDFGDSVGRPSSLITLQKEYLTRFLENGWTIDAVMKTSETGRWTTYRKTNSTGITASSETSDESRAENTTTANRTDEDSSTTSDTTSNSVTSSTSTNNDSSTTTTNTTSQSKSNSKSLSDKESSSSSVQKTTGSDSSQSNTHSTSSSTSVGNSTESSSSESNSVDTSNSLTSNTNKGSSSSETETSSSSASSSTSSGSSSSSSSSYSSSYASSSSSNSLSNSSNNSSSSSSSNSTNNTSSTSDTKINYSTTSTQDSTSSSSKSSNSSTTNDSDSDSDSTSTSSKAETTTDTDKGSTIDSTTTNSDSSSNEETVAKKSGTSTGNTNSTTQTTTSGNEKTSGGTSSSGSTATSGNSSTCKSDSESTTNDGVEEYDGDAYWAAVQRVRMVRRRMQPELVLQDMISSYVRQFNDGVANEDARFNELVTLYGVVLNRNETEGNAIINEALDVEPLFNTLYYYTRISMDAANNRAMQFGRYSVEGAVVEIRLKYEALISSTRSKMIGQGTYNGTVWPTVEAGIMRQMEAAMAEAKRGGYKDAVDAHVKVLEAKGDVMAQLVNAKNAIAAAIDQRKLNVIGIRNNIVTSMINFIGSRQDAFPQIQEISQLASQIGFTVGAAGNVL